MLRWMLTGLALAVAAAVLWGGAVAPRLINERRFDVAVPGLPAHWDGRRIAFVSDFQYGMWLANTGTARRIIARLVDEPPAAVLLGGDFLYSADPDPRRQVAAIVDLLRPLVDAAVPLYAVLGNHDVATGVAGTLANSLQEAGVTVLQNEAARLVLPDHPADAAFAIVGVGPHRPGRDRPQAAVAHLPPSAPRVVFMHHPASFPALPAGSAPLAIAGHTHCGQIRVPFTPRWSLIAWLEGLDVPMDGWAAGYGRPGNRLYVSCGVGFSRVPIRLGARPELTVFTLRPG